MELERLIRDYLEKTQLMQLSTSLNDKPWTATVYFAYDNELNLYWVSKPDRRHSLDIVQNPNVSAAIVKPHTYGEKVRGLQLSGIASRLSNIESTSAIEVYSKRYSITRDRARNIAEGSNGEAHVVYRLRPELFVLFDEVNSPDDPRKEWRLQAG